MTVPVLNLEDSTNNAMILSWSALTSASATGGPSITSYEIQIGQLGSWSTV